MKKIIYLASLCLLGLAGCDSNPKNNDAANLNATDRDFMVQAAYGNLAEVEAGKMAKSKANSEAVKMFGDMMSEDHHDAYDDLKKLAKELDVEIPKDPDQEHKDSKDRMEDLSAEAFDAAYVDAQVMDHQKTVALFESEINNGADQRVKDYANKYLPTIKMHLEKAQSLSTHP